MRVKVEKEKNKKMKSVEIMILTRHRRQTSWELLKKGALGESVGTSVYSKSVKVSFLVQREPELFEWDDDVATREEGRKLGESQVALEEACHTMSPFLLLLRSSDSL